MRGAELLELEGHDDGRGVLVALDGDTGLPFPVRRAYLIVDPPDGVERGGHAVSGHAALLAVTGSCEVEVHDGTEGGTLRLDRPDHALCLHAGLWRRVGAFVPGTRLLSLSSLPYAETAYFETAQPDLIDLAWT